MGALAGYKIVSTKISNASRDELVDAAIRAVEEQVEKHLAEGWEPHGDLVITPLPPMGMLFCRELVARFSRVGK